MNTPLKLKIITSTTRPGRKGEPIATWALETLKANPVFDVELLDLAAINLPFMDEAAHPRLKDYKHAHTKAWSAKIDEADAFVIVLGEYNYGFPAPIKNAIDFLFHEWAYKPVGFVSYGGLSGGTRSLQMIKGVVTSLKMVPLTEAVNIPFFTKYFDDQENFKGDDALVKATQVMLGELERWAKALKPMRQPA
ncbi:NADPH-dependent FMN reductase [Chryseolinea lacunae]|uniref:NAD(P)H-dependent oxidoreductase n=1 Tax=Chryseolinea lacunae TaxID=2801331 RepID=A0ABS1KLI9_9BACT|nr:NAD(P)H-dependent oxidoreductase [Chryseolinea lacunae]MBL0740324.1 NAD(P)H-dependent oxidoreductase [Chryseolinea lacunae]